MNPETLYLKLPVFSQNLLCSLYGYRLNRRRYGKAYIELEKDVFSREFLPAETLQDYCLFRLRATIRYAVQHVPFYRRLFAEKKISPDDICSLNDLSCLPILDKATVQRNLNDIRSDELNKIPHSIVHTSGTTGAGLIFPMSLVAEQEQWAIWWRYRSRFGIDKQIWYGHFYGKSIVPLEQKKPPFWRINIPGRQILFSAYHMSTENLPYYIEALNRKRPPWIQGYPSLLAILASYILENDLKLDYQPDIITIGAESLLPHQKAIIEKAFGTSCRQHYGMTEGVANISECPCGNLHVDEDYAYVEFQPINNNFYRIIGTNFTNKAFPLIRYDTGDVAELWDEKYTCNCGRSGRLVKNIDGRIEDYIVTPDGRRVGRADHIFKDMINIKECQIYQDNQQKIEFRIVRGMHYNDNDERILIQETRKRLGLQIEISISYVDTIERSNTGKLRFVISKIPQSKIDN